jgi:hypothetical protein
MGCFFSVQDPPPYKRDNETCPENRVNQESRSEDKHVALICLVCGKQVKNDYVSVEAHYVYCDEEFQTPPEIKTWQKLDAMTEYERKQRRFGDV